jgi:vacuolar-type H+-ATPase subunit H
MEFQMARLRDVLDRFRPAAAPGAAAAGGVPADRGAEQAAELAPVFELLRADEQRARSIRDHAAERAEQVRAAARERAAAIVEQARYDTEAVRARIVAQARVTAESEQAMAAQNAERDAESLRQRAEALMPGCVARVRAELDRVLGGLS